jgi:hypothetical protein
VDFKTRLIFGVVFVALGCGSLCAQLKFDGQILPGVSTRTDVVKTLGAPIRQDNATDFEYKPPAGAQGLVVCYDPSDVVFYITATLSQPTQRDGMVQVLALPSQTQPTKIMQGHLVEYFGAPNYMTFVYEARDAASGVMMLRYDSPKAFAGEVPGGGTAKANPPTAPAVMTQASPPPNPTNAPATSAPAPSGQITDVLRPLEANKSHVFVLRLLTPISSTTSRAGDPIRLQVISSDPAQGSTVTGTVHSITCAGSGMLTCVLNFSLDFLIYNGQAIPVVANLSAGPGQSAIANSKGWPHVDEEGNVASQGGNYLDAITKPQIASSISGKPMGLHPDVFIEMTASGPTLSFAAGSQFMAALSSDLGRLRR